MFVELIRMREVMHGVRDDKVARGAAQSPEMEAWSSRAGIGALISVGFMQAGTDASGLSSVNKKCVPAVVHAYASI